ncbi:MAG: ATP-binding cassette domain-containing protein [Clostridia bacterium]|nr:ATP-binding cassette domain-containing protein [Clostridia bacterium]
MGKALEVHIKKRAGSFQLSCDLETDFQGTFGMLGASGCGKSMTLRCIAGLLTPDEGSIVYRGRVLYDSKRKICVTPQERHVGYLFQNYALFPTMTVEKNLESALLSPRNRGMSGREKKRKIQDAAALLRIDDLMAHRPHQLSGGQQQRVALARIVLSDPDLLLLDEPFSALDSYLRTSLQTEFSDFLKALSRDAVLVTHDRDEAYRLCPEMAIMDRGRVAVCGTREDVFANPGTRAAAAVSGCKNFSRAEKKGPGMLRATDWAMDLYVQEEIPEDIAFIGLRAHNLHGIRAEDAVHAVDQGRNVVEIRGATITQTPFSVSVVFPAGSSQIRWEIDRSAWRKEYMEGQCLPEVLEIDPGGIMCLRD